ncbi:type II toxin-antitoxin system PemK/MazF family toxin [Ornithinibacillus contaminans]|uniref:type II toxin-antitoxin system PemK/MazF family toxin n=1 Tax=Ornithinibacillus contaminans TaxID=694055 RepID=UPI00069EC19A|nr:type II toxin-antitoxin system PemK/MazF family toxin [Ornithinibacillus contaminans]
MTHNDPLEQKKIEILNNELSSIITNLKQKDFRKTLSTIKSIPKKCELDQVSKAHAIQKRNDPKKLHPTRPARGDVYNVIILDDNVGRELIGNHLCVVISNKKKNIYSEKVNVVPIEGDGNVIDPKNNIKLTNDDMASGALDKDPSKIIAADIMTIDKARLDIRIGTLKNYKLNEVIEMVKAQIGIK